MRYILTNFYQFVKRLIYWFKTNILCFLLILLAFGAGLITGGKFLKRPPIVVYGDVIDIKELNLESDAKKSVVGSKEVLGGFVASSRGKYYYPSDCSLAKSLSPANLLHFETEASAIEAGYIRQERCY